MSPRFRPSTAGSRFTSRTRFSRCGRKCRRRSQAICCRAWSLQPHTELRFYMFARSHLPRPVSASISRYTAIAAIGLLALGFACLVAGWRVNTTPSIPVGLYWMTGAPVGKGEYVIFCPPQSALFDEAKARGYIQAGFCPGDYGFMMKRVLAADNDRVVSTAEGLRINGELLPASVPLETDKAGRMMPRNPFND